MVYGAAKTRIVSTRLARGTKFGLTAGRSYAVMAEVPLHFVGLPGYFDSSSWKFGS